MYIVFPKSPSQIISLGIWMLDYLSAYSGSACVKPDTAILLFWPLSNYVF